jgi:hypothetical protein
MSCPPPAPYSAYTPMGPGSYQQRPSNGPAIAALVLGICAFVILGPVAAIPAVIFGVIGLRRASDGADGRGLALAGLILGIVNLVLTVSVIVLIVSLALLGKSVDSSFDDADGRLEGPVPTVTSNTSSTQMTAPPATVTSAPTPTVTDVDGDPLISIPDSLPPGSEAIVVLRPGGGPVVADGAQVTVNYTGVLWSDGSVFDSSHARGVPATFPVERDTLIIGFYDAVVGQPVGSRVLVVVPPDAAYGAEGTSGIPPYSTLVYVIDIVAVAGSGTA